MTILRWILVFPAAVLAAILSNFIWRYMVMAVDFVLPNWKWLMYAYFFVETAIICHAFVRIGAFVAPSKRIPTSIVLAALMALGGLGSYVVWNQMATNSKPDPTWQVVVTCLVGLYTLFHACVEVADDELEKREAKQTATQK